MLGVVFHLLWFLQLIILPPVEELQTDPDTRARWIDYSAYDAKATWQLAQALRKALMVSSRQVQLKPLDMWILGLWTLHVSAKECLQG